MRITKILSLATTVLSIKALWWDKLSQKDKEKYISKVKGMFEKNKDYMQAKSGEFINARDEAKASGTGSPTKEAAMKVKDSVVSDASSMKEDVVDQVKSKVSGGEAHGGTGSNGGGTGNGDSKPGFGGSGGSFDDAKSGDIKSEDSNYSPNSNPAKPKP